MAQQSYKPSKLPKALRVVKNLTTFELATLGRAVALELGSRNLGDKKSQQIQPKIPTRYENLDRLLRQRLEREP